MVRTFSVCGQGSSGAETRSIDDLLDYIEAKEAKSSCGWLPSMECRNEGFFGIGFRNFGIGP